jgi:hypothetical protein
MRRQSESLAVLGGSASRRQWTRQVTMHEVLRAAIAEVEQYSRVKVVPPIEGVLRGAAVADVIHLIAELVENATKFSPPRTQALLRCQAVAAGVAIEVEDRGLGMLPADQQRMNAVLADPGEMNIDELLRDGRIGLYVVSTLARRHGVRVQLQGNIYGGTSAIIVLPMPLLESTDSGEPRRAEFGGQAERQLVPVGSPTAPEAASRSSAAQAAWPPSADGTPGAGQIPLPPLSSYDVLPPAHEFTPQAASQGQRPPLPKRQAQAHLAPPLREHPYADERGAARHAEPPAEDQMPGLMADFLKGVSRSDEEDPSARD